MYPRNTDRCAHAAQQRHRMPVFVRQHVHVLMNEPVTNLTPIYLC